MKVVKITETPAYLAKRAEINAEINKHKIFIDREVFKKTPEEKISLKIAKTNYRKNAAQVYIRSK
jgi:hypothetical protein